MYSSVISCDLYIDHIIINKKWLAGVDKHYSYVIYHPSFSRFMTTIHLFNPPQLAFDELQSLFRSIQSNKYLSNRGKQYDIHKYIRARYLFTFWGDHFKLSDNIIADTMEAILGCHAFYYPQPSCYVPIFYSLLRLDKECLANSLEFVENGGIVPNIEIYKDICIKYLESSSMKQRIQTLERFQG